MPASPETPFTEVHLDREQIAGRAADLWRGKHPKRWRNSSASQKAALQEEFREAVRSLEASLAAGSPAFFTGFARWQEASAGSGRPRGEKTAEVLAVLREVLPREAPRDLLPEMEEILAGGQAALSAGPQPLPSFLDSGDPLAPAARAYLEALLRGDSAAAGKVIDEAIGSGEAVPAIYRGIVRPVLQETGRLWQIGKITVAEEHYISAATRNVIGRLHDRVLSSRGRGRRNTTLVAAGVAGELHDLGIRIVADFFALDGWEIYYTGADTPAEDILSAVRDRKADAVALSCTLPYHVAGIRHVIRMLRSDPAARTAKILVGGHPFQLVPGLWQTIGADAWGTDEDAAVAALDRLVPPR